MKLKVILILIESAICLFPIISSSETDEVGNSSGFRNKHCYFNFQCESHEKCDERRCIDACDNSFCGANSICKAEAHVHTCECLRGYEESPNGNGCISTDHPPGSDCLDDFQCKADEKCISGDCINPCDGESPCGPHTDCIVLHHVRVCTCQTQYGYFGDPDVIGCSKREDDGCNINEDCPSDKKCIRGECTSPCDDEPCGTNTNCYTQNHIRRCECLPDFIGDPYDEGCINSNSPPGSTCLGHFQCQDYEQCDHGDCINPCSGRSPCGPHTDCIVISHQRICSCQAGYTGEPGVIRCSRIHGAGASLSEEK